MTHMINGQGFIEADHVSMCMCVRVGGYTLRPPQVRSRAGCGKDHVKRRKDAITLGELANWDELLSDTHLNFYLLLMSA